MAIFKVLYDPLNIVDASDNPLVAASLNDALVVRRLLHQFGVRSAFIGLFLDREPVQMRNGVGGALARPQTPNKLQRILLCLWQRHRQGHDVLMIQQLGRRLITASPLADENAGPRKPRSASQRPDWGFLFWNNHDQRWVGQVSDSCVCEQTRYGAEASVSAATSGRGFFFCADGLVSVWDGSTPSLPVASTEAPVNQRGWGFSFWNIRKRD